jgi:hypothetical protein
MISPVADRQGAITEADSCTLDHDKYGWSSFEEKRSMRGTVLAIRLYSREAVLNPGETCEIPLEEGKPNLCLIFDEYKKDGAGLEIDGRKHCLLLCLEVFRSEMEYAIRHGSAVVLQKLKDAGYYPYSDRDRKPVF